MPSAEAISTSHGCKYQTGLVASDVSSGETDKLGVREKSPGVQGTLAMILYS